LEAIAGGNSSKLLISINKINYCDLVRGRGHFRMVFALIQQLRKFGNLIGTCPMKPGKYTLDNFSVDETIIPGYHMVKVQKLYGVDINLRDENQGKSISLFSLRIFFKRLN
jgi:Protein of unknown function (DUF1091)